MNENAKPHNGSAGMKAPPHLIDHDPGQQRVMYLPGWFERFARRIAQLAGRPIAFFCALGLVLLWLITGPVFHFSDTWQLVINTGTTIITFLMVFLIQQSQNRDTLAIQVKLSELIIAVKGAHNRLANAEELSEQELSQLHTDYCRMADAALKHLEAKRSKPSRHDISGQVAQTPVKEHT